MSFGFWIYHIEEAVRKITYKSPDFLNRWYLISLCLLLSLSALTPGNAQIFRDIDAALTPVAFGAVDWADYDNDGDPDILLTGLNPSFQPVSIIYQNDGGTFQDINAGLTGVLESAVDWGDFDNDGDPDILLAGWNADGQPVSIIYRNDTGHPNQTPGPAMNLRARFEASTLSMNWDPATDIETPAADLSYNLRIGTVAGGASIKSPMAASDGYRRVPALGNIHQNTSWQLQMQLAELSPSPFLNWQVQAVDQTFAGGPFSDPDTFFTVGPICSVTDVPLDQGGKVTVCWRASELDNNVNFLTHYSIWRMLPESEAANISQGEILSSPDIPKNFSGKAFRRTTSEGQPVFGEWLANQPAHRLPIYAYTAATVNDSSAASKAVHFFMVSSHTSTANIFFDAVPVSGYSVDNLSPDAPQNLNGRVQDGAVILSWQANEEPDFGKYPVYRSDQPNIDPEVMEPLATTGNTTYTDENPAMENVFYVVVAEDVHNNRSGASNEVAIVLTGISSRNAVETLPEEFALHQNFPNPFNPSTTFRFDLPESAEVVLEIYNPLGHKVAEIVNDKLNAGRYQIPWNASTLSSGVYVYVLRAGNFRESGKLLLLK